MMSKFVKGGDQMKSLSVKLTVILAIGLCIFTYAEACGGGDNSMLRVGLG